jgi:hypothetical protein
MKQAASKVLVAACFMLGLIFNPEDGRDMFLRTVGCLSTDYTTLYPRRKTSLK